MFTQLALAGIDLAHSGWLFVVTPPRAGIPVTLATLAIAGAWLWLRG